MDIPTDPITYVAYDEEGNLIGYFIQVVQPAHYGCWLPWLPAYTGHWTEYRVNEVRNGLEPIPVPIEEEPAP